MIAPLPQPQPCDEALRRLLELVERARKAAPLLPAPPPGAPPPPRPWADAGDRDEER